MTEAISSRCRLFPGQFVCLSIDRPFVSDRPASMKALGRIHVVNPL